MQKEIKNETNSDTFEDENFINGLEILYYGVLNYIDNKTNEKRVYLTGATDNPNLVGFLLNQKMKERHVQCLSNEIECTIYENDMFEDLAAESIFVNKNNYFQDTHSENIFYDEDKVMLFEITKMVPDNVKRKNFKTDKDFANEINNSSEIIVHPLDSSQIIIDLERLSKSTFFSCPLLDSKEYESEINNFINSKDYDDFDDLIQEAIDLKEFLSTEIPELSSQEDQDFILEKALGEEWKEQLELLKYFMQRSDLILTVSCIEIDEIGTFGNDNKENLLSFIGNCLMLAEDEEINPLSFSVIVRQFTDVYINKKIPEKNVGACIINEHGIFPLSKKDIMMASLTCAKTGKKLKKEENVTYMSFNNLLQELNKSENKTLH